MIFQENYAVTPNTKWHVISSSWFSLWQMHVGVNTKDLPFTFHTQPSEINAIPGKIDNSDILLSRNQEEMLEDDIHPYYNYLLKPGLAEGVDYILVPDKAFKILEQNYGVIQDIVRYTIEQNDTIYQIEVYLKTISIAFIKNNALIIKKISTSRKNNISYIKKLVLKTLNLHCQSRAWKIDIHKLPLDRLEILVLKTFNVYLQGNIIEEETIIDDAEISEGNLLLIEISKNNKYTYSDDINLTSGKCLFCQNSSLKVACKNCGKKLYCHIDCLNNHEEDHKSSCKPQKKRFFNLFSCLCRPTTNISDGEEESLVTPLNYKAIQFSKVIGLQNLGNTCFMNSAIQCLSHTQLLSRFFLSGEYSSKINRSNPLGTKGRLASAYAELLHSMENSNDKAVAPWKLKKTIAEFAPQFLGHQQHDSQELLQYLISGLHEDLNQIKKKPYYDTDIKESTDIEMAA